MSKPSCEVNAGIYLLKWSESHIVLRADRLKEHSDSVSAEVTIKSTLPGIAAAHLHQARLNLTSTTSRKSLAKFLEERYGLIAPWPDMLEQACVMILERYREGDPPIPLHEVPVREALLYRAFPFLLEKQANLFFGAGQSGKSMLAVYLSVLVSTPFDHSGITVEPGKVLYVDYETDEHEIAHRVRCIQAGLDFQGESTILYRSGKMPLADDIERIQRIVVEHEIDFVVVDSLGMAAGGDQDKSMDIIRYFQALRTLNLTTLTIDHLNKEGKLYGNVYKFNEARNIFEVKAVIEPGIDRLDIGLYHRKMNNGHLCEPLGFRFQFNDTRYQVVKQDVKDISDLADAMPLRMKIKLALTRGAMTVKELAMELKTSQASVRNHLNTHRSTYIQTYDDSQREPSWGLKSVSNDTHERIKRGVSA